MKPKLTLICSVGAVLFASFSPAAKAGSRLGPDLPLIGDANLAFKLDKAGSIAAEAGNLQEAKTDYQQALAACLTDEIATLGLARCAVAEGDFTTAIGYYRSAVYGHHEDDDIDLLTEYILVLNQANQGPEAVSLYNHVADLCKKGYAVNKIEAPLPVFHTDGSDYNPVRLQAMTHLIRAINSSNGDEKRVTTEIKKATLLAPAPDTFVIQFYQRVLKDQIDKTNAGITSEQMGKTHVKVGSPQVTSRIAKTRPK